MHSFNRAANIAVIGASGGLGSAFVRLFDADERVKTVYAFSRTTVAGSDKVMPYSIDVAAEESIEKAAQLTSRDGPLDIVLVTSGILHDGEALQPEKSMRELDAHKLQQVYAINAIGPALVAKHFLPQLRRDHKSVFAALSARVGSITDNRLGGWAAYRASKAALNMLIKTVAIEHARRMPRSIVVSLHPGTVATRLSKPFSRRVPESQVQMPLDAASNLLRVIDSLTPGDSGGFFAWDGSSICF